MRGQNALMSRSGEQWIEETGGFRFGESPEQFQHRVRAIEVLTKKLKSGNGTEKDLQLLCGLKGLPPDEFDPPDRSGHD